MAILDFEASSLDDGTYPIEVGICRWEGHDAPFDIWSSRIQPTREWRDHGSWTHSAARVHGIQQVELIAAPSPTDVVAELNARLAGRIAYCDGGEFDRHWLRTLGRASGQRVQFDLGDFYDLEAMLDEAGRARLRGRLRWVEARHRAGADAQRLMEAFAHGLGEQPRHQKNDITIVTKP